jgi:hypothetical protein
MVDIGSALLSEDGYVSYSPSQGSKNIRASWPGRTRSCERLLLVRNGGEEVMIERVISGGQTWADETGLRAARVCGLSTGGWAPHGWLTEAGLVPWLADWGLVECREGETEAERYRARRRCVADGSAALVFGDLSTPESRGLIRDCREMGKPWVHVQAGLTTLDMSLTFSSKAA